MTDEEFLTKCCKPGVTMADFKAVKLDPEDPELKKRLAESRERQKEILRQKNAPFRNYRITI
jgi:hypothetical protein